MDLDLLDEAVALVSSLGTDADDLAARARDAIDRVTTAAILADEHGGLQGVNSAAAALTGYSTAELLRLSVHDITHPTDEALVAPLWRAFLGTGRQRGSYEIVTRRGAQVSVEYAAVRISAHLHLSLLRPSPA